jgi:hypothetical protein
MSPQTIKKIAAGAVAVVVIGVGAAAVGNASSGNGSSSGNQAAGPGGAQTPGGNQRFGGGPPGGGRGFGTPVTGATAAKVQAAVLAKYPGTVERVMSLPDGSYVAHVFKKDGSGEVRVLVDKSFNVTGTQTRPSGPPPGAGQVPPNGAQPPAGAQPGTTQ